MTPITGYILTTAGILATIATLEILYRAWCRHFDQVQAEQQDGKP